MSLLGILRNDVSKIEISDFSRKLDPFPRDAIVRVFRKGAVYPLN